MQGWAKIALETPDEMHIQYSIGRNDACDGLILYDKETSAFYVQRVAKETSKWLTGCFIRQGISEELRKGILWHQKSAIRFTALSLEMTKDPLEEQSLRVYGC